MMDHEANASSQDFVARVREILGATNDGEVGTLLDQAIREYFRGTVIEDAKMGNTLFKNLDLSCSLFADADLNNTLIFDANLSNAHFVNVNLTGASIKDANLDGFEIDGILIQPLLDAEIARRNG